MGMSEQEFWDCTPRYFAMRRKAWLQNRQIMEAARFVAFHVIKTVDIKSRFTKLTDIVRFEWEPAPQFEPWDKEEMEKFSEQADKALEKLNPAAYAVYMAGKKKKNGTLN